MAHQRKTEDERISFLEHQLSEMQRSLNDLSLATAGLQKQQLVSAQVEQLAAQVRTSFVQEEFLGGAPVLGERAATPVGVPADQCWQFTIRNNKIKGAHTAQLVDDADCVFLQSAAVEDGEATFVVCCKKQDDGQCKDCVGTPQLQVKEGNKFIATKDVSITCRPGP